MLILEKTYKIYKYRVYPNIKSRRGATRILFTLRKFIERNLDQVTQEGDYIGEEEWDNLIILDGCRHDLYEEVEGETEFRVSLGSSSAEFIEKNFSRENFSDTVLITGNPHFHPSKFKEITGRTGAEVFYEIFHTYQTDWDKEVGTIPPEPIVRDVKTAEELFPDKKKIIWFMQPHHPFVNSKFSENINDSADPDKEEHDKIWSRAERGEFQRDKIWEAYKSNLEFVMPKVREVLEKLKGDTVITSDHGNLVGEGGLYGHPSESKAKKLRIVPWDKH